MPSNLFSCENVLLFSILSFLQCLVCWTCCFARKFIYIQHFFRTCIYISNSFVDGVEIVDFLMHAFQSIPKKIHLFFDFFSLSFFSLLLSMDGVMRAVNCAVKVLHLFCQMIYYWIKKQKYSWKLSNPLRIFVGSLLVVEEIVSIYVRQLPFLFLPEVTFL